MCSMWSQVEKKQDDKDDKYSIENTHVHEILHVSYAKSNTSPKYTMLKISQSPKPLILIYLILGGKICKAWNVS